MFKDQTRSRTEVQFDFYTHLVVYLGINVMLFFIWVYTGGFPWFAFPLLGWGVALLAHFMQAFIYPNAKEHR